MLPLTEAYAFATQHGLNSAAHAIHMLKIRHERDSSVRRAHIANLFERESLFEEFCTKHWPFGLTPSGKTELKKYQRYLTEEATLAHQTARPQVSMAINEQQFRDAHEAFLAHVLEKSGAPFRSFRNQWLLDEELRYKWRILDEGRERLQLKKWPRLLKTEGAILDAVRQACRGDVARNLLEHRYGPGGDSDRALYRVSKGKQSRDLELALSDFLGGFVGADDIAARFNRFCDYLRERKLGCNWPFLSYLLFLADPTSYFPIHPGRFDAVLKFYRTELRLSGRVEWSRYRRLLEVADDVTSRLALYGVPQRIEVQSYMWIVGTLISKGFARAPATAVSPLDELQRRVELARRREATGLAGEEFVLELERSRLKGQGRNDLAAKVEWTATLDQSAGFDVRSFHANGAERHIEVKSTSGSPEGDSGFWISRGEYETAQHDPTWELFRVYEPERKPSVVELGNLIVSAPSGWRFDVSSWHAAKA